jgi:hypothetical protein
VSFKKFNPQRRKKLFERNYGGKERVEWIKSHRCSVTGLPGTTHDPIVASHVKSRGAGGGAEYVIPMLLSLEKQLHSVGISSFQELHDVDLYFLAELWDTRWINRN